MWRFALGLGREAAPLTKFLQNGVSRHLSQKQARPLPAHLRAVCPARALLRNQLNTRPPLTDATGLPQQSPRQTPPEQV